MNVACKVKFKLTVFDDYDGVNTNCHLALYKFEVPSLNRFGDRGVPKLQKWVTWPHMTPS